GPLRDRMEIIEIGGYTEDEKLGIAQGFLMLKQREFHGLADDQVKITDAAVLKLIREYTREAGVRNLERELASLCRKIARKVAATSDETNEQGEKVDTSTVNYTVDAEEVITYLGPERFSFG